MAQESEDMISTCGPDWKPTFPDTEYHVAPLAPALKVLIERQRTLRGTVPKIDLSTPKTEGIRIILDHAIREACQDQDFEEALTGFEWDIFDLAIVVNTALSRCGVPTDDYTHAEIMKIMNSARCANARLAADTI